MITIHVINDQSKPLCGFTDGYFRDWSFAHIWCRESEYEVNLAACVDPTHELHSSPFGGFRMCVACAAIMHVRLGEKRP